MGSAIPHRLQRRICVCVGVFVFPGDFCTLTPLRRLFFSELLLLLDLFLVVGGDNNTLEPR